MADFVSLTCPSCGSRLQVTPDLERFACGYCGNELVVHRGGGIVSLKPVMEGLGRIESKLDRNTEEIRRLRLVSEIEELQHSRADIVRTLAVQQSTHEIANLGRRRRQVRGVFFTLIAFSLLTSVCSSAGDGGSALVGLVFGGLFVWLAMRAFGINLPSRNARRMQAEADALSQSVAAKRRELEQP